MATLTYATKDEIPEDLRSAAKEVKDGDKTTYQIKVVSSVKLDEFRDRNVDQARKLEAAESVVSKVRELAGVTDGDLDLTAFAETIANLRDVSKRVDDGKLKTSEEIEKALSTRTESMRDKHNKELQAKQQEIANATSEAKDYKSKWQRTFIDRAVMEAARDEELGVESSAVQDIVARAYNVYRVGEDGELIPEKNGQTIWGEDGATPMSVKEWVNSTLRKDAPHYFKKSKGGGATGGDSNSKFAGMSEADFMKLSPEARLSHANATSIGKR